MRACQRGDRVSVDEVDVVPERSIAYGVIGGRNTVRIPRAVFENRGMEGVRDEDQPARAKAL